MKRPEMLDMEKALDVLGAANSGSCNRVARWMRSHIRNLDDRAKARKYGVSLSYLRNVLDKGN